MNGKTVTLLRKMAETFSEINYRELKKEYKLISRDKRHGYKQKMREML